MEGIIPEKISVAKIHRVLQNLLKNQISIRNFTDILEIIGDHVEKEVSIDELSEYLKNELSRFKYLNEFKQ